MKKLICILIYIFLSSNVCAKLPLKLIGKGDYTFFFMDVYEASLWAQSNKNIYEGRLRLELKYKMNFKGRDIVKQTKKEFLNADIDELKSNKWSTALDSIFPDVSKGDRIEASFSPSSGIKFYLNEDSFLGEVKDIEFSKSFLNIWLGPKSSDPQLRDRLLGVSNE